MAAEGLEKSRQRRPQPISGHHGGFLVGKVVQITGKVGETTSRDMRPNMIVSQPPGSI